MKKIFFIMSTNDVSGAEKVNFRIIDNLSDKYEFYWVSKKGPINNYLKHKNINWIEIKDLSIKEIKRIIADFEPDILHATDFKASVICSLTNSKIPLIEHIHNNSTWIKKICFNSLAFLYAGIKASKILTVSNSIEEEYIFSKILKNKITCINNPVSRKEILDKTDINNNKIYDICCVGRLTAAKNPQRFIMIINELKKQFPKIKAIWVGDGELKDICINLINKYKLEANIKLIGFQKNPYTFMSQSKIFMLAGDWEGYGLVAFEALTLGLPCVVSSVGGLKEIVDNSCGKLCNNVSEFVLELKYLLENKVALAEKSKNAILKSKELDNTTNYMNTINIIYENLTK